MQMSTHATVSTVLQMKPMPDKLDAVAIDLARSDCLQLHTTAHVDMWIGNMVVPAAQLSVRHAHTVGPTVTSVSCGSFWERHPVGCFHVMYLWAVLGGQL